MNDINNVQSHRNKQIGIIGLILFYGFIFAIGYMCGYNPFNTANFSRWDSGLYQSISESGYFIEAIENSDALNGNAGWFPLFPFLTFILKTVFGLSFSNAAFIISFVSCYALIIVFLTIIDEWGKDDIAKEEGVFFLCTFIGSIYLTAAFPLSLCLLFMNLSILSILRKKYVFSGIYCFIACLSYSTAFLFCGVLGCYLIYEMLIERNTMKSLAIRLLKAPVLGFCGFLAVQVIIYLFTGNIKAFFLTQKKYGHGIHNPLSTLIGFLHNLSSNNITDSQQSFISLIFLSSFIYLITILIKEKLYKERIYVISLIPFLVIYSFLLIMGTGVSPYRQYLMCADAALIMASKRIHKYYKILLGGGYIVVLIFEVKLFFDFVIV